MTLTKRQQKTLWVVAALILVYSIESLLLAKDIGQLQNFEAQGYTFDSFILMHMMQYAIHVFVPIVYGIMNFFRNKRKEGIVFRGVFSVLLGITTLARVGERQFRSPFFYISILLLILLIYNLNKDKPSTGEL